MSSLLRLLLFIISPTISLPLALSSLFTQIHFSRLVRLFTHALEFVFTFGIYFEQRKYFERWNNTVADYLILSLLLLGILYTL